ncbi:MAG: archaeosine biosynthesis radical SAM protein RaSEA [Candidatus Lokiarchaeota archaeon]|nr:archaeosine biosynthesis radical SAM protein RaSEA [Candidatus Lokiarchaeota archaeon]
MSTKKFNDNNFIVEKIKNFRSKAIKKNYIYEEKQLNKPISFWIKEDRLLKKKGKEFTIILRTRGCSWALGPGGGCSMCGYIQDSTIEKIDQNHIKNQIDFAFQEKISEIIKDEEDYVLKIYNSGSFFDDDEISEGTRDYIYKKIAKTPKIREVVIESRVDYVTRENLTQMKSALNNIYIEVAIGLETVNDHIRNVYINKGLFFKDFLEVIHLCKNYGIGVRAYLLFKPPFLNEQSAIDDCVSSILKLAELKVNTISINPLNIQKNTLTEYLFYQNRYRPPWFYSLFKCIVKACHERDILKEVRIISSPSGAGSKRGIHNCLKRECNEIFLTKLKNFVLTQDIKFLIRSDKDYSCDCLVKYQLQKRYI